MENSLAVCPQGHLQKDFDKDAQEDTLLLQLLKYLVLNQIKMIKLAQKKQNGDPRS